MRICPLPGQSAYRIRGRCSRARKLVQSTVASASCLRCGAGDPQARSASRAAHATANARSASGEAVRQASPAAPIVLLRPENGGADEADDHQGGIEPVRATPRDRPVHDRDSPAVDQEVLRHAARVAAHRTRGDQPRVGLSCHTPRGTGCGRRPGADRPQGRVDPGTWQPGSQGRSRSVPAEGAASPRRQRPLQHRGEGVAATRPIQQAADHAENMAEKDHESEPEGPGRLVRCGTGPRWPVRSRGVAAEPLCRAALPLVPLDAIQNRAVPACRPRQQSGLVAGVRQRSGHTGISSMLSDIDRDRAEHPRSAPHRERSVAEDKNDQGSI